MITHPTVLKIDAEAQQFAAHYRPAAMPESSEPDAVPRQRHHLPATVLVFLRGLVQRRARTQHPAAPSSRP
ncbi:MAG TPA: hypothetical protein VKV26_18375 [Dehalococcoidia bacterium]|nr:hypothetical protein [Dehalococcoidia bacterium]